MTALTVEVLKDILAHLPSDFTLEYSDDTTTAALTDPIIIDVSGKRVIFQS